MQKRIQYSIISMLMAAGLLVAAPAFAQTQGGGWGRGGMMHRPAVVGTVSAINGTTLTVTEKAMGPKESNSSGATVTVDASNASVLKDGATSTVSAIAVNDFVIVQGTVSGSDVSATVIRDGAQPAGRGPGAFASIQGNGEPVIGGSVSAINGDTLTVTNTSNVTYTVDAASATVEKGNATSSIAAIATGDKVLVQGTVNGNAVTASLVIDQAGMQGPGGGNVAHMGMHGLGGFFGAIGGLLQRAFGFF